LIKSFFPFVVPANYKDALTQAFEQYEEKNYSGALEKFSEMENTPLTRSELFSDPDTDFYMPYYKAICLLAQQNARTAIATLLKTHASNPVQQSKKEWYLSLAYLKSGNFTTAKTMLIKLNGRRGNNQYAANAKQLLQELHQ
jgi:hypothetical protein